MHDHSSAPLFEAVQTLLGRSIDPLHTPGHKGRFLPPGFEQVQARLAAFDVPSMYATDNTFYPHACIREAEELAADLFGSARTRYLTQGSSSGILAAFLATLEPGQKIVLGRDAHKSIFSALVLSGAMPIYLPPRVHSRCGVLPARVEAVEAALAEHPEARTVQVTRPTYYGLAGPVDAIANVVHAREIPLLVDEAHGAHLRFLPPGLAPSPALSQGADFVVQSVHKTLGSLVGSAQCHLARGGRLSEEKLQRSLNLIQSTSPSYLSLISLDLVRKYLASEGEPLFAAALDRVRDLRRRLDAIPGVEVFEAERLVGEPDIANDPFRLVVRVAGLGKSGFEAEEFLRNEYRIEDEFSDFENVIYILTPFDPPEVYDRLVAGLTRLSDEARASGTIVERTDYAEASELPLPALACTPREAYSSATRVLPIADAVGVPCGETIVCYPPGIPIICAGEIVDANTVETLRRYSAMKASMRAHDMTLETITVLDS